MIIASAGHAFPEYWYPQATLTEALVVHWPPEIRRARRLRHFHEQVQVKGRHLALPLEAYGERLSFKQRNDAFIRVATELGERAIEEALVKAGLRAPEVDCLMYSSITGLATPSIDARLMNRLGFRSDVKRTPIFGLGCVGGAAGLARCADYLRGWPDHVALLLCVELCSLTLQREDPSIPNMIASGLFGDGAAAAVMLGAEHSNASGERAPVIQATRSVFYPNTEDVMGWNIGSEGFQIVLSADVPKLVLEHLARDIDAFLKSHGLSRKDITTWVCHPGGPRVLEAYATALELPREAFGVTWKTLAEYGNLSSASVLVVLEETMALEPPPKTGTFGMMLGMGPGFCAELLLLKW